MKEKQHIVIFGGPDRCGKTTIAKELARQTGFPYFKPANQKQIAIAEPDVFAWQTEWGEPKLLDFLRQTGHSVIMDRGFPCDWVYSKVLGRETAWDTISWLDIQYETLDAANIFTLRRDGYAGRKDDSWNLVDSDKLQELHDKYIEYAEGAMTPTMILWVDDEDLPRQIQAITDFLREVHR